MAEFELLTKVSSVELKTKIKKVLTILFKIKSKVFQDKIDCKIEII